MQTGLYVALSAQISLQQRMETLAQNVANANSAGYRAQVLDFKTTLARTGALQTDFVTPAGAHVDPSSGGLSQTKNPLDIAAKGDGFFGYQNVSGATAYSRDGRLSLASDGRLINANGDALVDAGGAALQLDPNSPDIAIAPDGSITQGGQARGKIGLYKLDLTSGLQRAAGASFTTAQAPDLVSGTGNGVLQGYVEDSNVNPATAMTGLIELSRAFESVSQLTDRASEAEKNAIEVLGSR